MTEPSAEPSAGRSQVLRNVMFLMVAQALGIPLSIALNAMLGRYLGPGDLGYIYVATSYCATGLLFVEWGQNGTLPAMVARVRTQAGELLGTGITWRLANSLPAYLVLAAACWVMGYDGRFQLTMALVMLALVIGSVTNACQDVIRGFERTDVPAVAGFAQVALACALVLVTLLVGGRLHSVLLAQTVAATIVLFFVWRTLKGVGVGKLVYRFTTLKALLSQGYSFFLLNVTLVLQPSIDAAFLSRLAPSDVVGWHAAARKLIGTLVFPAGALVSALYPTLARLHQSDPEGFRRTASSALRSTLIIVTPLALGCFLYPQIGSTLYSQRLFFRAEENLRTLSVFVFLVYFGMTLGTVLVAMGRQRSWALVQSLCLVISVVVDPIAIPYFQEHYGNGGLGLCLATTLGEVLMVGAGLILVPRGLFTRVFAKEAFLVLVAGVVMVLVARALSAFNAFAVAPIAVLAYLATLLATGGLDREQLDALRRAFTRNKR